MFSKAEEVEPDCAPCKASQSICHILLGDYETALQCINCAIELEPKTPRFPINKVSVVLLKDDIASVQAELEKAKKVVEDARPNIFNPAVKMQNSCFLKLYRLAERLLPGNLYTFR